MHEIAKYIEKEGRLNDLLRATAVEIPLSEDEFLCCCDANLSTALGSKTFEQEIAMNVEDSGPDGLAEKWHVDLPALVQKLNKLTAVEMCALLAAFDGFFKRTHV